MLDLGPIKDRLAAASPGPWQWFGNESAAGTTYGVLSTNGQALLEIRQADRFPIEADLRLVANAPADLAALVAEVEWLRAEIQDHRDSLDTDDGLLDEADRKLWAVLNA